jgi:hypothetical protein
MVLRVWSWSQSSGLGNFYFQVNSPSGIRVVLFMNSIDYQLQYIRKMQSVNLRAELFIITTINVYLHVLCVCRYLNFNKNFDLGLGPQSDHSVLVSVLCLS